MWLSDFEDPDVAPSGLWIVCTLVCSYRERCHICFSAVRCHMRCNVHFSVCKCSFQIASGFVARLAGLQHSVVPTVVDIACRWFRELQWFWEVVWNATLLGAPCVCDVSVFFHAVWSVAVLQGASAYVDVVCGRCGSIGLRFVLHVALVVVLRMSNLDRRHGIAPNDP